MNIDKTKTYHVGDYTFENFVNLDGDTAENIRVWRNHPDIRKMMYNKKEITKEEHLRFLASLLGTESKLYWLVSKCDKPIGVVSVFDINKKEQKAELGYYLFPSNLNSGISVEFLTFAHLFIFEEIGLETIYGGTNVNNTNARLLNKYFGGIDGHRKELNGEIFIHHEINKRRFEERKEGLSNWRNFIKFCKKHESEV